MSAVLGRMVAISQAPLLQPLQSSEQPDVVYQKRLLFLYSDFEGHGSGSAQVPLYWETPVTLGFTMNPCSFTPLSRSPYALISHELGQGHT